MNIYVGNLSFEVSEDDLQQAFSAFGQVATFNIIKDKFSGESWVWVFVDMPAKAEAEAAISGLNGTDLKGRTITINEARPRTEGRGGGGGGRGGDRRGGGGYGGRGGRSGGGGRRPY